MSSDQRHFPNRVRATCATAGTDWQMLGLNETGYATYALLAASTTPFPGTPQDFPTGVPRLLVRSINAAGTGDGSAFSVATNTLSIPSDADDLVSASGQTLIYEEADVKNVWFKKTVSGDQIVVTAFY